MRRKEKEIVERERLMSILERSRTMRLGLSDGDEPYVVPVSFGVEENAIYVHSAPEGRKLDVIRKNPMVCFEVDEGELRVKGEPCTWGMRYESVIGWGRAKIIEEREAKEAGLGAIVRHYGASPPFRFDDSIDRTVVIRIEIERMTGKASS